MSLTRHKLRGVLSSKRGIATSIPEALAGVGLKAIIITAIGGVLATTFAFWAVSSASADASSGFQTTGVAFEKAVAASDVVVGIDSTRVGLLKDVDGDLCEVQTWQNGTRDGEITLQVDKKTVAGVCTPTTPLLAAGSTDQSQELLFQIDAPAFSYSNLGGREITFNSTGAPTLTTGGKPDGVKQGDWDDVRPYKVQLRLQTLDEDAAQVTKKSVSTGYTNVVNVTAAEDSLRYVPAPSTDPIPGPLDITSVTRSTTIGTVVGEREGIAVTFTGAVCESGPTKVVISYTQQTPSAAPTVNTVVNAVFTGSARTVELGSVPNGSSGVVEAAATCIDEGVVVKDSTGYTQRVPATILTVKQNSTGAEKHDLSWTKVSSLPTSFELRWTVGPKNDQLLTTTDKLAYTSVNGVGANLGLTTTYTIVATVDTVKSPVTTASIANPLPQPAASIVTSNQDGATWSSVSCPSASTAQYSSRYYQQTGTSTAVNWTAMSAWSTDLKRVGVTTPGYGRTVLQVHTRCYAPVSGVASATSNGYDVFYTPEALTVSAARSTSVGTAYQGAREGMLAMHSGARCYNGTSSKLVLTWKPVSPSGQADVASTRTLVPSGSTQTIDLANVRNGAKGSLVGEVSCTAGKSSTVTGSAAFTQTLPAPTLTVKEGTSVNQHVLSWTAVSSLPTTFQVAKSAQKGAENATPASTTALTQTLNYTAGTNFANKTDYTVTATVNGLSGKSPVDSITGSWPAVPKTSVTSNANGATWTAVTCPAGSTPQYASRYYKQTGTSTTVSWAALSAFSTGRSLTGNATPAYGRTVTEAHSRCVSSVTGLVSPTAISPVDSFYAPEAISVSVARSTTTGTAYQGAREGALATYSGGRCYNNTPSTVAVQWRPSAPSGQSIVSAPVNTKVRTTAADQVHLANVRNGATGSMVADVSCTAGKSSTGTDAAAFTQTVPAPAMTVAQGTSVNQHVLSWGAVSSLPTTFQVAKTAAKGTENATPAATTALSQTLNYLAGTNYGNKTDYTVKATVGSASGTSPAKSITGAWPTTPKASSIAYARTGAGGLHQAGNITWALGSCPSGTTIYAQALENRTGQTNGTIAAGVKATGAWGANLKTYAWAPSYSYQGFKYGVGVNTKCRSNVTGLESAVASAQGSDFVTPMAQPKAPVFNFHNYRNGANGSTTGYVGTCYRLGGVNCSGFPAGNMIDGKGGGYGASYKLHYNTSCAAGSSLNYTNVVRDEKQWNNVPDVNKPFDYLDGYQMSAGAKEWKPKYKSPVYDCKTPFATSPRSVVGTAVSISVKRIWGS